MKRAWLSSLTMLFLLAGSARAQEERKPASWDGIEIFGQVLKIFSLRPIPSLAEFQDAAPGDTLLIVFGDLQALDQLPGGKEGLRDFLKNGGAALLASDHADGGRLGFLKVQITGREVIADVAKLGPGVEEKMPRASMILDASHPLMHRLGTTGSGLATNGPSDLLLLGKKRLQVLARFQPEARYAPTDAKKPPAEPLNFMAGTPQADPPGRVLVLAGQGVFFNGMLLQGNSDNFQFAWNCIHWLKEARQGQRKQVLVIHNGEVVKSFPMPLSIKMPANRPPIPTSVLVNRLLRLIEENRVLQNFLEEEFGLDAILRVLLLVASALLLVYGSWRLARGMLRIDTNVPLLVEPIPAAGPAEPAQALRFQAVAKLNNFAEPAQVLARQWFFEQAAIEPFAWDEPGFRGPLWKTQGSWLRRWRNRRLVRSLARQAAAEGSALSARRFQKLARMIEELNLAVRNGEINPD